MDLYTDRIINNDGKLLREGNDVLNKLPQTVLVNRKV